MRRPSILVLVLALLGCARAGVELPPMAGEAGALDQSPAPAPDPTAPDRPEAEADKPETHEPEGTSRGEPDADADTSVDPAPASALTALEPGDPALPFALVELDEARAPSPSIVDSDEGGPWMEPNEALPSPATFGGVEVEGRPHMPAGLDGPTEYWIDLRFPAGAGAPASSRRAIVSSNLDYCETEMSAIEALAEPDPERFVLVLTLSCTWGEDHAVVLITKAALILDTHTRAAEIVWIGHGENTTEYSETWHDAWAFNSVKLEGRTLVVRRREGEAVADPDKVEDEGWKTTRKRETETFRYELPPR